MKRIAIIGGGISGLSAAYTLEEKRQSGTPVEYVLFESSPRLGGVLVTDHVDGCIVEAGPDSFLTEKPWAADLCAKIGLGDQLIGSNDSERKTYILAKGKLVECPMDSCSWCPPRSSPPSSLRCFPCAQNYAWPPNGSIRRTRPPRTRRLPRWLNATMDPRWSTCWLIRCSRGVYGGEASQLSVRAVLPRFADMEAKHGSLGRAMLSARMKLAAATKAPARPLFSSLKDGMQQMVDALVACLDTNSLKTSATVQSAIRQDDGWTVSAGYETDQFDALIVAIPAQAAAAVLQAADKDLSHDLGGIQYSSSVTVTLGYDEKVRASLPPGFGFLVPRSEGHRMLAATFVHNKFPHRAPENRAIVRCFLGGARDEQILQVSEPGILEIVRSELREIIGLTAEPLFARVYKWKSAMAQYSVGHLERLQRIESFRQTLPGLALAGNGYNGIGVPDCVRSGTEAAGKILAEMGMWSSA